MKRIIVPTDFSPNADKALNFAVQIARKMKSELFLVHATEIPDTPLNLPTNDSTRVIISNINDKLAIIKKSIYETELITVTTKIYTNTFIESLSDAITEFKADLIIMGTVGNSGIQEKLFGSKTAIMIGKNTIPVFAIPLLYDWTIPRKILIAINEPDINNKLLDPVFSFAKNFLCSVQVAIFTDTDDDAVEEHAVNLYKIKAIGENLKLNYKEIDIDAVHLAGRRFQESLNEWVNNEHIDILVMLTHKRTFFENIFNPSKTKKMSYKTNIPLLAIPI